VYAGHATEASLSNVSREATTDSTSMPASVPASLLADNARPGVVKLATFAPQESSNPSVTQIPAAEQRSLPTEEIPSESPADSSAESSAETLAGSDLENPVDRLRTGP